MVFQNGFRDIPEIATKAQRRESTTWAIRAQFFARNNPLAIKIEKIPKAINKAMTE